ncbi:hypothetical protein WICPIJ_000320 [Wickerhamomyces pijperi]|uniref:Uncharacterized protein n=1 Tax=Wickerhamomyces pijperi TaxID=599730 RepID=A0A9P8QH45_WICPI|nr:hypothetical protein WICPIJ_000320 [Wickerhamomyces pijperi]
MFGKSNIWTSKGSNMALLVMINCFGCSSFDGGVDDLQEQLTILWIHDENTTIDWLGGQVAFNSSVDSHSVDIGVIDEQLGVVTEQLSIIGGV